MRPLPPVASPAYSSEVAGGTEGEADQTMNTTDMPTTAPRKRRHLEAAPDAWIAAWLSNAEGMIEEARLQKEKDRRRQLKRNTVPVEIGILVPPEGVTPEQRQTLHDFIMTSRATRIWHPREAPRKMIRELPTDAETQVAMDMGAIVRTCSAVIAAPKEPRKAPTEVWDAIRRAKQRGIPVLTVLPNGEKR